MPSSPTLHLAATILAKMEDLAKIASQVTNVLAVLAAPMSALTVLVVSTSTPLPPCWTLLDQPPYSSPSLVVPHKM